jgi:hypothetical protein
MPQEENFEKTKINPDPQIKRSIKKPFWHINKNPDPNQVQRLRYNIQRYKRRNKLERPFFWQLLKPCKKEKKKPNYKAKKKKEKRKKG